MTDLSVLDLFSAAAGGWSLGMHRAGFHTVAACEFVDWRRALYLQNNPGVRMYDDVRTLTGQRLLHDLGFLPGIVVGSPPCQDISPANTKGKGVEGERSGLYFQAVRIIGEIRPRWFALENSANLRTKGADAVLSALETLGYSCWSFVVRAGDIGANHERARSWLVGCDLAQVADAPGIGCFSWAGNSEGTCRTVDGRVAGDHAGDGEAGNAFDAAEAGRGSRFSRGRPGAIAGAEQSPCGDAADTDSHAIRLAELSRGPKPQAPVAGNADQAANDADAVKVGSQGLAWGDERRQGEIAQRADIPKRWEMGLCATDREHALQHRADWSLDDLADHLRLDDGLSTWVAGTRIAVGGPRGTSAASLIVEAFGDAVVPQIPEAIGRAILRTERALQAIYSEAAA